MTAIVLEIIVILLLVTVNGVLAMSEIAIVTARKFRLERRAARGDVRAQVAVELAREPTQFLSTVQIGITLVGILTGAFGGATLARVLDDRLEHLPGLALYSEPLALSMVVLAITYLSLVVGELVPKRIGLNDPDGIAVRVARPMRMIARVASPAVRVLTASTNLLLRLLRVRDTGEPRVTEEEISALIRQGAMSGAVLGAEQGILERALLLGNREVTAVMTPRPDIEWIDLRRPPEVILEQLLGALRSHFLVCDGSVERVLGVARAKELLAGCLRGEPLDLASILRQPLYVPSSMPVMRLLEIFRRSEVKVAVVLDEFGTMEGLVTMDDILEDLVAGVPGRADVGKPDIVRRDDGGWLIDGAVGVDDLASELGIEPLPASERGGYRTVGGLVMAVLGHVPAIGECFEWAGHRFEVVDLDGRRIDRVLVTAALHAGSAEEIDQLRWRARSGGSHRADAAP